MKEGGIKKALRSYCMLTRAVQSQQLLSTVSFYTYC
jgi:hypothetical protein